MMLETIQESTDHVTISLEEYKRLLDANTRLQAAGRFVTELSDEEATDAIAAMLYLTKKNA